MRVKLPVVLILFVLLLPAVSCSASAYSYGKGDTIIGLSQSYAVKERESLIEIARKFDLGYGEIAATNPDLDPFVPGTGASVRIPTFWVLPEMVSYEGIVINLSEMRLYYFFREKQSSMVRTFPIGIGREGFDSPEGSFTVIEKIVKPSWHVPESIRKEKPELPAVVPPGPDNPLGSHALRLSIGDVLIHGTNKPWGVGRRVSHGCIRLYPEDIPKLFQSVPLRTKVAIVRQPVKVGVKNNKVYIEVHSDESVQKNYFTLATELLRKRNLLKNVNTEKMYKALQQKSGIPIEISN